ncbi:MAG: site-specific integrase [Xanthomonadaceae bacterium]|nr:site-specific integrase [Xanthomonadaceae bacterium]
MAVDSYQTDNGETLWKVYVNIRSTINPTHRAQKRASGLKSKRDAEREEVKLIRECEREIFEREAQGQTWGSVLDSFVLELKSDDALASTTLMDYLAALKNHTTSWLKRSAATITKKDVKDVIDLLKADGSSYGHQRRVKGIINKVFCFGIERGLIPGVDLSPTVGVELGREIEKKPEILTLAEIRELLESARSLKDPWYPIWALALMTGMRSGELYALSWKDIDWENNLITINKAWDGRLKIIKNTTKAGYWRAVPMSSELRAFLTDLKSKAGDREGVLEIPWKWTAGMQAQELRKFCIGMKLPSIRFHTLRACFATQLIRNGVPPIQMQKICGWRDLKTMQRYIRVAGIEIDGATEALKVLSDSAVVEAYSTVTTKVSA